MPRSVGGGAGFAGDRIEPAVDLARSGAVDDIVLECLAERTMVYALRQRRAGEAAFDPRLRRRLTPLLPAATRTGTRIISNIGAADPVGAAEVIQSLASELGLRDLRVAAVVGDAVAHDGHHVRWTAAPEAGDWLGAHAYTGSEGIAQALREGADVVITGRAADSALAAGPLRDLVGTADDALAGALMVGHLLECSGQITGGNYQAAGGARLAPVDLAGLGYPIATVSDDGSAELTLLPDAPGCINRDTTTLQLLYEVHDPSAYFTPDGIIDMTTVQIEEVGRNRVRVSGATSHGIPSDLKVSGFVALPGLMVDVEIGFGGPAALARAREAAEILRLRFDRLGAVDPTVDLVGVDSLLGPASAPLRCEPPEIRVHASVACGDAEMARAVEDELVWLSLAGPAAGGGIRVERRDHVAVVDGRIAREHVTEEIVWVG
jgi:hypothetical protein